MHTNTCTRANSARSAVREIINRELLDIGHKLAEFRDSTRKRLRKESGLDGLYKRIEKLQGEAEALRKANEKKVDLLADEHNKSVAKRRDALCSMRSEVLFAKSQRLREMYEELSK